VESEKAMENSQLYNYCRILFDS